jgi:hypothetical protein
MEIFISGVHVSYVDYTAPREGTSFIYDVFDTTTGVTTTYSGVFTDYSVSGPINF